MSALVEEYEQCGETQMGFCQRQGLALSSFQAGLRRRRQQKANARTIRFNPSAQDRPLWDDNDSVLHFFPAEDDRFQTLQRSRGPERKRLSCFKAGNLMIYKIKPTIAIRAQVRLFLRN